MRRAAERGILNGCGDGRLNPGGLATRAQAAQMLKNFMKNQEKTPEKPASLFAPGRGELTTAHRIPGRMIFQPRRILLPIRGGRPAEYCVPVNGNR